MLVKYYGLSFDEEKKTWSPRSDFIENGLFRMTQPKYLNDQASESRVHVYFNEFSPSDYEWAKKKHRINQLDPSYIPSKTELETWCLKPVGSRYGDEFPHLLNQDGFSSMEDFDKDQLIQIAEKINSFLVEVMSCHIGVFSLSKSEKNLHMWTHYAQEGRGLAVIFNETHPFFKQYKPKDINYKSEKRVSLTYYKGSLRLDGSPLKNFRDYDLNSPYGVTQLIQDNNIDTETLSERLLYSKGEEWLNENEARIICPLKSCEAHKDKIVDPDFGVELSEEEAEKFRHYEISLKKIPFDAIESIVLGYRMSELDKVFIKEQVKKNEKLCHVKLRVAKLNVFGKVELTDYFNEL